MASSSIRALSVEPDPSSTSSDGPPAAAQISVARSRRIAVSVRVG